MLVCISAMIGFSDFSADLKLSEVIDSLYFGAPNYVISIVESFFSSSNRIFLIISPPFFFSFFISIIPLTSTDGSLILEQISSIAVAVFFASFSSFTDSIPFLPISMNAS